tara:strand:- start:25664 stop:26482 length:819 start_codon:yes stop_codon:yes gene_type:complete
MKTRYLLFTLFLFFGCQSLSAQKPWNAYLSYGFGIQPRNSAFNAEIFSLQERIVFGEGKHDHGPVLHNFSLGLIHKKSKKLNFRYGINYQNVFQWDGVSINGRSASYQGDSLVTSGEEERVEYGYTVLGFEFALERNLMSKNKDYNFWIVGGLEAAYVQRFDSYELFEIETQRIRESFTATYDDVLLRGLIGVSAEKVLSKKLSLRLSFLANPIYYFSPYRLRISNFMENYNPQNDQEYNYSTNPRIGYGELQKERVELRTFRINLSLTFDV